jgi:predicted Rossmann fold flavoprotein
LIDLVIVGGGAAGFFAANEVLRIKPNASVVILEKTGKVLAKVKISGGGRCNVTHNLLDFNELLKNYPRGERWLSEVFKKFSVKDTLNWFENKGVKIKSEPDGRMFPESNDSQTIIDALQKKVIGNQFELRSHSTVKSIIPQKGKFEVLLSENEKIVAKNVLISSGGSPTGNGLDYINSMQFEIVPPAPSLFTFNVKNHNWVDLMGLSVTKARVRLIGTDLEFSGPVLITHWGFSGPAILKLSSFAARILQEKEYKFNFSIDWIPDSSIEEVQNKMTNFQKENPKKKPDQSPIFSIPKRLWERICKESGLSGYFNWAEAGNKKIQLASQLLKGTVFKAEGKTTYKEEFVTAGGISLKEINAETCEAKRYSGLFFAGEVMDVDGVTGGFNFQAAWSTGFVAATAISKRI